MKQLLYILPFLLSAYATSQLVHWQQYVDYTMFVDIDVETHQYKGTQEVIYTNNSPDRIDKVFYHLYFNAFQPGSQMAVRIKSSPDPNGRFRVDLDSLSPNQQGWLVVSDLKQDGKILKPYLSETILEVPLSKALESGESTTLTLNFRGQVPDVIRRAGKNSSEGVAYSMAQWFPKIAQYDYQGWNTAPYLGREFHSVWGNFDVKLRIDSNYTLAATGLLQNPHEIGHGYSDSAKQKIDDGKLTWHFKAEKVLDFTWAADPDYIHDTYQGENDVTLRFFYKDNPEIIQNWKKLQPLTAKMLSYFNEHLGQYPYKEYNVVQGGDGGMEYSMLTLITGNRPFGSLVGVTCHELAHSWFQHHLATNEMKHEWMDEGFTVYISTLAMNDVFATEKSDFPLSRSYQSYFALVDSGVEEPQSTDANRYEYNFAYERTAYSKGSVFLSQLGHIIGPKKLAESLKQYVSDFGFKHPFPDDFRRVVERVSGIHLQWYLTDWTQTIKTIDYKIDEVVDGGSQTYVKLERMGQMPMPLDVLVSFSDGSQQIHYIPIPLMRGEKENHYGSKFILEKDWPWAYPDYTFIVNRPKDEIVSVDLNPTKLVADINPDNNTYQKI
ncbi:MAG: M1 family metallopeptidase [Flavobacteriaceae bacterium]|nr:M1 family metallopeptidase [Flavobacteriaceae bacterium]